MSARLRDALIDMISMSETHRDEMVVHMDRLDKERMQYLIAVLPESKNKSASLPKPAIRK
jgi:hypothetical protein